MTLQEYLGTDYQVTEVEEEGRIRFNVKRGEFNYETQITYHPDQAKNPNIIKLLGNTVHTKYSSWKFLQELRNEDNTQAPKT